MCAVPAEELSLMSGPSSALRQQLSQAQETNLNQQLQIQRYTGLFLFMYLVILDSFIDTHESGHLSVYLQVYCAFSCFGQATRAVIVPNKPVVMYSEV